MSKLVENRSIYSARSYFDRDKVTNLPSKKLKDFKSDDLVYDGYEFIRFGDLEASTKINDKSLKDSNLDDNLEYTDDVSKFYTEDTTDLHNVDLTDYLSDFLKDQNDYLVFIGILQLVFNDIKYVADTFPDISDVNRVSEIFLPKLASLIKYEYRYNIDVNVNRDIIKRLVYLYTKKGTDQDILDATNYANNPKWYVSTLFLPGATPDDKLAQIDYPIDHLFTHDVSTHSGTDRFQDSTRWRDGIILIKSSYLTEKTREAVKKVLPAGIKAYYDLTSDSKGDGNNREVVYGEWTLYKNYELDYILRIKDNISSSTFSGSQTYFKHRFDGKRILFFDQLIDFIFGSSMLPTVIDKYLISTKQFGNLLLDDYLMCLYRSIPVKDMNLHLHYHYDEDRKISDLKNTDEVKSLKILKSYNQSIINHDIQYEINGVELYKRYKGLPRRSNNAGFSGKYAYGGEPNVIYAQTTIKKVLPTDTYYPVNAIENLIPNLTNYDTRYLDTVPYRYIKIGTTTVDYQQLNPKQVEDLKLSDYVYINEKLIRVSDITNELNSLKATDVVYCLVDPESYYLNTYCTDVEVTRITNYHTSKLGNYTNDQVLDTGYDLKKSLFNKIN